jgi:hypothetical protein
LIGGGEAFGDVPADTLAQLIRDAMRDLLGGPQLRSPRTTTR